MGFEIWKLFEQGLALSVICDQVARRYNVALEVIARDVQSLMNDLAREMLIVVTPVAGGQRAPT